MKVSKHKQLLFLAWLMIAISGTTIFTGCGSSKEELQGAGSTFVNPLFTKMFSEYNTRTGIKVLYQSIGSGGGINQLTQKTVDFAGTDMPFSEKQDSAVGIPVLHIPIACGGNVVSYNLPSVKDTLKFTPDVIADIFLGKITKWNDPKIASINTGVNLPDTNIVVVHRLDGSGTTFVWTDYLSKISEEWKSKIGRGLSVNWPVGSAANGNEGVTELIKQTKGAIGYVELAYAVQNNLAFGKVQNKSGNFITPSLNSITIAGFVPMPSDTKVSITNTDHPDGYPISSFTWAVIYKEQNYGGRSKRKADELVKLLKWTTTEGQQFCAPLNYAPISGVAQQLAGAVLKNATYDGKPILPEEKEAAESKIQ